MATQPAITDVFRFMELRAPFSPQAKALRQNYIRDDSVGLFPDKPNRIDTDLQSATSPSAIGRLIYEQVFCTDDLGDPAESLQRLISAVLGLLTPSQPLCPANDDLRSVAFSGALTATRVADPLQIFELERYPHILDEDLYYLLPERLEKISGLKLFPELLHAFEVMEETPKKFTRTREKPDPTKAAFGIVDWIQGRSPGEGERAGFTWADTSIPFLHRLSNIVKKLEAAFGGKALREVVFQDGVYSNDFRDAKRTLFDTLYLLYILRRRAPVNLEYVIEGLRVLHVVEALAVDSLIEAMRAGPLSAPDKLLWATLETLFSELQGWNGSDPLKTLPLIQKPLDFEAYFTATPIIHPIFARLHWYKRPFNDIKPIGVGDLKVVKQWLTAYLPGEISYIENVLIGEIKDRTHRRLEKTEESFSFSSDSKESSQKDAQSTDRLELKREVDNVVKSETNVGVNTNSGFTGSYGAGMVVVTANVGATFGYKRDTSDQSKTSNMFSRETISKAVEQVEKNVSERRSVTKLFETEETNKHGFDNSKPGAKHVTGIYRWLDKKYKAQLFNYGKRMMFEFVIPEPAAFLVESRIRAFEATLECPQRPPRPLLKTVSLGFSPADIKKYNDFLTLRKQYDLSEVTFPQLTKRVGFFNPETGDNCFEKVGTATDDDNWSAETYHCKLKAAGYELTGLFVEGLLGFEDKDPILLPPPAPPIPGDQGTGQAQHTLVILVDGTEIVRHHHFPGQFKNYHGANFEVQTTVSDVPGVPSVITRKPLALNGDDVTLTIGLWDRKYFRLTVSAELVLSAEAFHEWQIRVFKMVESIEQKKVDKENQEIQLAYETEMSTYRNRLDQLKAQAMNDLLQGQSEAFNREIIRTELKKHCLTMLTKEFDSPNPSDDLFSTINPIQGNDFIVPFRKFKVKEPLEGNGMTTASFEVEPTDVKYPSINLEDAKKKGRFIQFLEQAFEWRQLSYIFYPYFWATPPKWIEMMNRLDETDPNMTAFLQAGSVRMLLAVTPAHDDAVLHFLATREPWEGGPAPVIGDPLFIPLHEELRKQQDDL